MKIQATFRFRPFSPRQKKVLTWWLPDSPVHDMDGIIADGAIRSGKTVSMSLSYVMWAMETFSAQNFGMAGKTIGSFRRNVLFWLKLMLRSRGYGVEDHRSDNMLVVRRAGIENYFYIFGGKDERSQDLIQGITLAGMFFDEVALMPQSFVNQATGRCSVEGSKFWFNCNPEGPNHWFRQEWILQHKKKRLLYLHFTMDDNWSLSEKIKARYRAMYTGVFFKRFIQGLWAVASGLIFDMYQDDSPAQVHEDNKPFDWYFAACDYGTQNPCTFALYGVRGNGDVRRAHICEEYFYDGRKEQRQKTDLEYSQDFKAFIGDKKIRCVVVDPSAASFIAQLKSDGWYVISANNEVLEGICRMSTVIGSGRFTVDPGCAQTRRERQSYVWDEKAVQRGEDKPVKVDDHTCDRDRYACMYAFKKPSISFLK